MGATLHPVWLDWPQTQALVGAFAAKPGSLRFVGGAVRDALLSRMVKDVDAATTLLPEAVIALLSEAGIRVVPTGIAHGTVTAMVQGKSFEITTLRSDTACDGRHAEVRFTEDWRMDASRRDFTMNAIYLSPEGEIFDYFGGLDDAKAGRVRFIGDAGQRIAEDYLRILRFFRFHAHYGVSAPDAAAVEACVAGAAGMSRLSGERVQAELLKLLAAPSPAAVLVLMQGHGVLAAALGMDVGDLAWFSRLEMIAGFVYGMPAEWKLAGLVWGLDAQTVEAFCQRLRLSNRMEKGLRQVVLFQGDMRADLPELAQKRLLRQLGAEAFAALVQLHWAAGHEPVHAGSPYMAMLALARDWQPPEFPVTGKDLIAHGIIPGKGMGNVLAQMEEAWEQSGYTLTKESLLGQMGS